MEFIPQAAPRSRQKAEIGLKKKKVVFKLANGLCSVYTIYVGRNDIFFCLVNKKFVKPLIEIRGVFNS